MSRSAPAMIRAANYQTTEAEVLDQFAPTTAELPRETGLAVVRAACDQLEAQVASLLNQSERSMFPE